MNPEDLIGDLIRDEGIRLKPYHDSVGKLTIGIGRNLDDVGITLHEARHLCDGDVTRVIMELDNRIPWWRSLNEPAQRGLANMCFQLGMPRLLLFSMMLEALEKFDYNGAADEALDSKYARQVPARAHRIAQLFRDSE